MFKQCLLWVAKKCGELIRFVVRKVQETLERTQEVVERCAELVRDVVVAVAVRIWSHPVVQTIVTGMKTFWTAVKTIWEKVQKIKMVKEIYDLALAFVTWLPLFLAKTCETIEASVGTWFAPSCGLASAMTIVTFFIGSITLLYWIGFIANLWRG